MCEDFYMDNILSSCQSKEKAAKLCQDITLCCRKGGFNLTKFCSNSREVVESMDHENRGDNLKEIDLANEALPKERTLSIVWLV